MSSSRFVSTDTLGNIGTLATASLIFESSTDNIYWGTGSASSTMLFQLVSGNAFANTDVTVV